MRYCFNYGGSVIEQRNIGSLDYIVCVCSVLSYRYI